MKEIVKLPETGTVPTGFDDTKFARYSFNACGDNKNRITIIATTSTRDEKSAFMTYVCDFTPCNIETHPGWSDAAASGFNSLTFSSTTVQFVELWLTVVGLGRHSHQNTFNIDISINPGVASIDSQ